MKERNEREYIFIYTKHVFGNQRVQNLPNEIGFLYEIKQMGKEKRDENLDILSREEFL